MSIRVCKYIKLLLNKEGRRTTAEGVPRDETTNTEEGVPRYARDDKEALSKRPTLNEGSLAALGMTRGS